MKFTLALLLALLVGCATPPKVYEFDKSWVVESEFDEIWSATVELFAERNWPISTLEKDSGIIVTDWVSVGMEGEYADCGQPGLAVVRRREVKFNVFIRKGDQIALTVNTSFRELRRFDYQSFYSECNSTGALEAEVHQLVLQRVR